MSLFVVDIKKDLEFEFFRYSECLCFDFINFFFYLFGNGSEVLYTCYIFVYLHTYILIYLYIGIYILARFFNRLLFFRYFNNFPSTFPSFIESFFSFERSHQNGLLYYFG